MNADLRDFVAIVLGLAAFGAVAAGLGAIWRELFLLRNNREVLFPRRRRRRERQL